MGRSEQFEMKILMIAPLWALLNPDQKLCETLQSFQSFSDESKYRSDLPVLVFKGAFMD